MSEDPAGRWWMGVLSELRVALNRRLTEGRYRVQVVAEANGRRITRTIALRVR